jgi:putative phage-type endonuclease
VTALLRAPVASSVLPYAVGCDSRERERWLAMRRQTIGASEAAAVLGVSPWSSLLALWAEKTGRAPGPDLDDKEFVFWGNELEESIVRGYSKRTGRFTVPFGLLLRSTRWPWLSATPDALVTDDPKHGARATQISRTLGHIRTAMKKGASIDRLTHELVEHCEGWWPLQTKNIGFTSAEHWHEGVPLYYRIQCAQEALVFGTAKTTGAALIAGQRLAWDDVEVDESGLLERQIVNLTRLFMRQHIELGVEPAADASESARHTIAQLYPLHRPDKVLALGGDWMERADLYDVLKADNKALEEKLKRFENEVRQEMTDAERCVLPDGSGFTLKTTSRGARMLLRKKAKGD